MSAALLTITICAGCARTTPPTPDSALPTSATNSSEAPSTAEAQLPDESVAFAFGRSYAFACLYRQLDEIADAEEKIRTAQTAARVLGVSEPTLPSKDESITVMRSNAVPDELLFKKGRQVSATFSLAVSVTDGWFGAALGSIEKQFTDSRIAEIEYHALAAEIPTEIWRAQVDAIKARPTEENFKRLTDDLVKHYKG